MPLKVQYIAQNFKTNPMKKIFTLSATLIAVFFLSGIVNAAKFRVNNSGVNGAYLQPSGICCCQRR